MQYIMYIVMYFYVCGLVIHSEYYIFDLSPQSHPLLPSSHLSITPPPPPISIFLLSLRFSSSLSHFLSTHPLLFISFSLSFYLPPSLPLFFNIRRASLIKLNKLVSRMKSRSSRPLTIHTYFVSMTHGSQLEQMTRRGY